MIKTITYNKQKKDPCWICTKPPVKYAVSHHVMGALIDPDLTVDLCRGCHMLEKYLSQRKFLSDAAAIGRLITLARFHAGLPDARTFVYYETDESRNSLITDLTLYLTHTINDIMSTGEAIPYNIAKIIYEKVYPHTIKT